MHFFVNMSLVGISKSWLGLRVLCFYTTRFIIGRARVAFRFLLLAREIYVMFKPQNASFLSKVFFFNLAKKKKYKKKGTPDRFLTPVSGAYPANKSSLSDHSATWSCDVVYAHKWAVHTCSLFRGTYVAVAHGRIPRTNLFHVHHAERFSSRPKIALSETGVTRNKGEGRPSPFCNDHVCCERMQHTLKSWFNCVMQSYTIFAVLSANFACSCATNCKQQR